MYQSHRKSKKLLSEGRKEGDGMEGREGGGKVEGKGGREGEGRKLPRMRNTDLEV